MTQDITKKYKALSDVEHIRHRPQMYVGSTEVAETELFVHNSELDVMEKTTLHVIPAFLKIVDEVLDNAVDEHKRRPSVLNKLDVVIEPDGTIIVSDNGGIPVEIHHEYNIYVPELIFGQLRSGSNYDDTEERMLAGVHGLGSKATNILSSYFKVETADGKNSFMQVFSNGMTERTTPVVAKSKKNYTKISFRPDYEFFKMGGMDQDHQSKIYRRLIDLAGTNPQLSVSFNGEEISIKNFKDYVALYAKTFVYEDYGDWKIGISPSNGFQQTSFVNSVETYVGGTHIDYVCNQIVSEIREHVKKRHKIDVKPSDIKSQFHIFISCAVNRPKFSSQTKENMISPVSSFGTTVTISKKFIKSVLESEIVHKVLDWAAAKKAAQDAEDVRKSSKNLSTINPKSVAKFDDAVERKDRLGCTLFLAEGISAKNSVITARGKNTKFGCYALKGKIKNVYDVPKVELLKNQEIIDLLTITGLKIGESVETDDDSPLWYRFKDKLVNNHDVVWVDGECFKMWEVPFSDKTPARPQIDEIIEYRNTMVENNIYRRPTNLRFGKIVILSDADLDGAHIAGLCLLFFYTFWPELFNMGCVFRMETPIYIATETKTKTQHFFNSIEEYEAWAAKAKMKYDAKYYKGLGTFRTEQFEVFFTMLDKLLVQFPPLDDAGVEQLSLVFDTGRADDRKEWLGDYLYFHKED